MRIYASKKKDQKKIRTFFCRFKSPAASRKPHERVSNLSFFYFVFSLASIIVGVLFFVKELKNSAMSPAESRDLNDECIVFFFDNHDLWHFFSAAGLVSLFMMVLTLEDDNMETPWEEIPVF